MNTYLQEIAHQLKKEFQPYEGSGDHGLITNGRLRMLCIWVSKVIDPELQLSKSLTVGHIRRLIAQTEPIL